MNKRLPCSNTFSISMAKAKPLILKMSVVSRISDTTPPTPLINLFSTYTTWLHEISGGKSFLIFFFFFANTIEIPLTSVILGRDIRLQIFINILSAFNQEVLSSSVKNPVLIDNRTENLISK